MNECPKNSRFFVYEKNLFYALLFRSMSTLLSPLTYIMMWLVVELLEDWTLTMTIHSSINSKKTQNLRTYIPRTQNYSSLTDSRQFQSYYYDAHTPVKMPQWQIHR